MACTSWSSTGSTASIICITSGSSWLITSTRTVSTLSIICVSTGSSWSIRPIITGSSSEISWIRIGSTASAICPKAVRTVLAISEISGMSWFSMSLILPPSSEKLPCSSSHKAVTLLRKSSFVSHRYIKPAASAATMAIIASTGPGISAIAVLKPEKAPEILLIWPTIEPHFIAAITEPIVPKIMPTSGRWESSHSTAGPTRSLTKFTESLMAGVSFSAIGCTTSALTVRPSWESELSSVS